jgi:hypothetical protein
MTIGRSDELMNPRISTALRSRPFVVVRFAETIWASGHGRTKQAGHMTAIAPVVEIRSQPLAHKGPSTHEIRSLGLGVK